MIDISIRQLCQNLYIGWVFNSLVDGKKFRFPVAYYSSQGPIDNI